MPPDPEDIILDEELLRAMRASVNAARDIAGRSLELIEQSRIMLRELNIPAGSTADESRKYEGRVRFRSLRSWSGG
jgi:hypothetical protein